MAVIAQPLFSNAGYLIGVDLVGSIVGFLFWSLATRLYQPEHIGTASAALSVVALIASIAELGMGSGLVRILPEARFPCRLLNTTFTVNAVAALFLSGMFLAGLSWWTPSLVILQHNGFYATGFLIFATAMTLDATVKMAFIARRRALYALMHSIVVNGGRVFLVTVLTGLGAAGLVGSIAGSTVLASVLSLLVFLPQAEPNYRPRPRANGPDLFAIVPYSMGNFVAGLLTLTVQRILPLMNLEILGSASSGHAYIAWMLGSLMVSPGAALANSAFAEGSHSPQKLTVILRKAAVLSLLLTVPTAMFLGIAAPWGLSFFGPSYAQEASALLRWLAAAAPPSVLAGLFFTWLRVQKQISWLVTLSGILAATTLGITAVLMPRIGIASNGLGWLLGNSLVVAIAVLRLRRGTIGNRESI
jgi:O-antigen/teichoic acid export membrane protein